MARRMIPAKLEGQLQKFNSNISEDGKLYLDGIVDADGNQRFIEGDIEGYELPEGITLSYGKWSLSGTHLMFVFILDGLNATAMDGYQRLTQFIEMPEWIKDKIINSFGNVVGQQTFYRWDSAGGTQTMTFRLYKNADKQIYISNTGALTLSADRRIRVQFDLLIDTEQAGE